MAAACHRAALLLPLLAVRTAGQRLQITNACPNQPIWIAHMANKGVGPDPQNVHLVPWQTYTFQTPPGLFGTRYWAKAGCDPQGNGCLIGESGGPGEQCDLRVGCAPPVDTKFEATFGQAGGAPDWVDVSLVDGWTLPFKFEMSQKCSSGEGSHAVQQVVDCSSLSLAGCPRAENVGPASPYAQDLAVKHPSTGQTVGCYSPCAKLTTSNWRNPFHFSPGDWLAKDYCCPTPPESPSQCRYGPVKDTQFVRAVHQNCPGVYGYSYDDGMGLLVCPATTVYHMTFYCPPAGLTSNTTTVKTNTASPGGAAVPGDEGLAVIV